MSNHKSDIIIGVDTHKSTHVAVAITDQGARLAAHSIPVNIKGYRDLEQWAHSLGQPAVFGIEGTGSYGAGLSRYLLEKDYSVVEITWPNQQLRYQHGKTDTLDAEGAARSVLNGQACASPKVQTGLSEMIRHLKVARDTAVKSRSQAMVTLKLSLLTLLQHCEKILLYKRQNGSDPGACCLSAWPYSVDDLICKNCIAFTCPPLVGTQ